MKINLSTIALLLVTLINLTGCNFFPPITQATQPMMKPNDTIHLQLQSNVELDTGLVFQEGDTIVFYDLPEGLDLCLFQSETPFEIESSGTLYSELRGNSHQLGGALPIAAAGSEQVFNIQVGNKVRLTLMSPTDQTVEIGILQRA